MRPDEMNSVMVPEMTSGASKGLDGVDYRCPGQ